METEASGTLGSKSSHWTRSKAALLNRTLSSPVCGYAKARRHHWALRKAKVCPPSLRLRIDLAFDCLSVYLCSIYSRLWPLVSIMKYAHMMVQNKVIKAKK